MNAVEIADAVSDLAERTFDVASFPYEFLEAFGNKEATIKKLRNGVTNKSDVGGVLQTNNVHIAVCSRGDTSKKLAELKDSPATTKTKAKFILATDGDLFEAEDINTGETLTCAYRDFANHFGFFLSLAGITTVQQIRESSFDIRATGRLNKLYVELLKDNPEWGKEDHRHEMNHFMARLIFCFFAEDTGIFRGDSLFTKTVERMSVRDSENTHDVIGKIFLAMNTKIADRGASNIPIWANNFPYVNGGLFSGSTESPRFSRIARSYLFHIGGLDWKQINPDIFGSMIQAVADDDERGALGLHYTSVPNILKVLNPLFLDDLREKLAEAGDNPRSLLNLRKRISHIRILDPACGSGNFLVIAYREMRSIEAEINNRRHEEVNKHSEILLTNFRGIELRDFPAEIARLALIIAEYQCDVRYRGERLALEEFLPLDGENWITCGNALSLDWLSICPPTEKDVKLCADGPFSTPLDQAEINSKNEGGETYICGNPPYLGSQGQSEEQKSDLKTIFSGHTKEWKSLDYISGWFMKAAEYGRTTTAASAFVSTNSICQGEQVAILWRLIFAMGHEIAFAYTSFKWTNLASQNAGVTVVIVGISTHTVKLRTIYSLMEDGSISARTAENINGYLAPAKNIEVGKSAKPMSGLPPMSFGNQPIDGGNFTVTESELASINADGKNFARFIRHYLGSREYINGKVRYCLWIDDDEESEANKSLTINAKVQSVANFRLKSNRTETVKLACTPHKFAYRPHRDSHTTLIVPSASSISRPYLPCGVLPPGSVVSNLAFALYDAELWTMAVVASRLHLVWIGTVCGKLKTDYRYSNTLGWNTFPVPPFTEKNKTDLTCCAEDILLTREAHFPATIADLYDPKNMPADLREAHERNDEVLERIYIGRRFKNDTERLEKLFELYTKMTALTTTVKKRKSGKK